MILPEYKNLDTQHFQRLFDNMAESYKLFWFRAVIDAVCEGKSFVSYDEIINDMIADSWYMVNEYRLNLGPRDTLEKLVKRAQEITGLKSSENREKIIKAISNCDDKEIRDYKKTLTLNVPYRLQSPLIGLNNAAFDGSPKTVATRINDFDNLIYKFENISGLESIIAIDETWAEYIRNNYEIISGWVYYNLINYLQRRNPSVPGIPNKMFPPQERKLERVKAYWGAIAEVQPVLDIYGNNQITRSDISIDHFIPWSYVAHDELWNLSPTTRSINSSKSNNLPDWEEYFGKLCSIEYAAYKLSYSNYQIQALFNKCLDEHVNSDSVRYKLYRPDLSQEQFYNAMNEIVFPVYNAAVNLGFSTWKYAG